MISRTKKQGSRKGAFTLIEVMVAVGIVAVSLTALIGLLAAIIGNVATIRNQTKAISIISALETNLKTQSFKQVYEKIGDTHRPYIVYFWDEYQNPDDVDNSSLITVSSEDPDRTSMTPPSREELKNASGEVFRVVLTPYSAGLEGQYVSIMSNEDPFAVGSTLPRSENDYALFYLPILARIYVEPREDMTDGVGTGEINEQRLVLDNMVIVKTR